MQRTFSGLSIEGVGTIEAGSSASSYLRSLEGKPKTRTLCGIWKKRQCGLWEAGIVAALLIPLLTYGAMCLFKPRGGSDFFYFSNFSRHKAALTPRMSPQAKLPEWKGDFWSPKVYVYDLPEAWSTCIPTIKTEEWKYYGYGAELLVPAWLNNSAFVTHDPEQADLFYVPVLLYCAVLLWDPVPGREKTPSDLAVKVVEYLASKDKYWARKGGRDHIFLLSQDHGFCGLRVDNGMTHPVLKNSIILSHWGFKLPEIACDWRTRLHNFGHCEQLELPPESQYSALPCFVPDKDVIIPTSALDDWNLYLVPRDGPRSMEAEVSMVGRKHKVTLSFIYKQIMLQTIVDQATALGIQVDHFNAALPKTTTFYFNGDVRPEDMRYSRGARQTIYALFKNQPGFVVTNVKDDVDPNTGHGYKNYESVLFEMAQSIFCLSASGDGWSIRLKQALLVGCIPVIAQDDTEVEFEEILPYHDFALRIPHHALYSLPSLLQRVIYSPGRVQAMQLRLNCAWRYLSYNKPHGRAHEALMCSLRKRMYGSQNIWPAMDWETCTLYCGGFKELEREKITILPPVLSISYHDQRVYKLVHNITDP